MKAETLSLLALGVAGLVLASKTPEGEMIVDQISKIPSGVRGIRNNNPGNIEKSNVRWQGMAATQTDPRFLQFVSMEYGIRAIGKILRTYQNTHGLRTVAQIIERWAPASENGSITAAYIDNVSALVGVDRDEEIDVENPEILFGLIRGIINQENGRATSALIGDDVLAAGLALALA
ncbi:MAG: structural protein [Xanthomonadales bacterium]|nr:structural protein [Xanthomonadales bacterium]